MRILRVTWGTFIRAACLARKEGTGLHVVRRVLPVGAITWCYHMYLMLTIHRPWATATVTDSPRQAFVMSGSQRSQRSPLPSRPLTRERRPVSALLRVRPYGRRPPQHTNKPAPSRGMPWSRGCPAVSFLFLPTSHKCCHLSSPHGVPSPTFQGKRKYEGGRPIGDEKQLLPGESPLPWKKNAMAPTLTRIFRVFRTQWVAVSQAAFKLRCPTARPRAVYTAARGSASASRSLRRPDYSRHHTSLQVGLRQVSQPTSSVHKQLVLTWITILSQSPSRRACSGLSQSYQDPEMAICAHGPLSSATTEYLILPGVANPCVSPYSTLCPVSEIITRAHSARTSTRIARPRPVKPLFCTYPSAVSHPLAYNLCRLERQ